MDEEQLIRAVQETPDDPAPFLIYADWLEERGQSDDAKIYRAAAGYLKKHPGHGVIVKYTTNGPKIEGYIAEIVFP